MMSVNERLARLRRNYGRLFALLDGDERGPLVMAEIVHVAAHLAEHSKALDMDMVEGKRLPEAWSPNLRAALFLERVKLKTHHDCSEDTTPAF